MNEIGTFFMPPAHSTMAGEVDALFYFIYYVALIIFVGVIGVTAYFMWKYRKKGKHSLTEGKDHNIKLEILWTVIPTLLVFIVFIWGFRGYMKLHVAPRNAMEVNVTAQKWFWNFTYAEGNNSINELVVLVNEPVKLIMSSQDVIHSFYVPDFRVKMDVLPNRYTTVWFEATSIGEFNLFCTEYCGKGHSEMIAKVTVLSEDEFANWKASADAIPAGMSMAEAGAKIYKDKACYTCHSIDGSPGVAPSFKGKYGTMEKLTDGSTVLVDENYIRESVLNPQAKVVAGFQPVMPTYQGLLKEQQIDALIAYIKSLNN
jgi:cytochrome c oxidase subunit 2